ncbi:MAG TPA: Ig-like domain-containing protein [Longimicrobiales bacterium]
MNIVTIPAAKSRWRVVSLCLGSLGLAFFASCNDGVTDAPEPWNGQPAAATYAITSISIEPSRVVTQVGQQTTLVAKDQLGNPAQVNWSTSNAAIASITTAGVVTANRIGRTTIFARTPDKRAAAWVMVDVQAAGTLPPPSPAPVIASVAVSPTSITVARDSSSQLTAVARDSAGTLISGVTFTWSSSNTQVATVSATGSVTGVAAGTSVVTATAGGRSASSNVTVTAPSTPPPPAPPVIASIVVTPSSVTLDPQGSAQLSAVARDSAGTPISGVTFAWITTNQGVATVSSSGVVTAVSAGTATIRASAGGQIGSSSVTVNAPPPPPPPSGDRQIVFSSDFSTALGTSSAAVTDGGRWNIQATTPETMRIISAAGLGFPSANVMEMIATSERQGFAIIRKTGMPIPAVGESRYYRWYIRVMQPDNLSDYNSHPIQDGNAASQTNWMFLVIGQGGPGSVPAGHYQPEFWANSAAYPNQRWYGPDLPKNQTYRYELQIHRVTSTQFQMHVRIYNSAGTLVADDDDFRNYDVGVTLASNPTFPLTAATNLDGLNAGNNGIANLPAGSNFTYAYEGAFAVCSGGWCGPYVAGEGR